MNKWVCALSFGLLLACSGDDGSDDGGECNFSGDSYLPIEVGNSWTYRVTDNGNGEVTNKSQVIEDEIDDPTFGMVSVQVTRKGSTSSTRSLLSTSDSEVRRLQQEDIDGQTVTKTTLYDPFQTRLSETSDHLVDGATWIETYTPNVDGVDTEVRVEEWTVESLTAACELPSGATAECLQVKRVRNAGLVTKTFWYAKGVGKVKEEGTNQNEVLTGCAKN